MQEVSLSERWGIGKTKLYWLIAMNKIIAVKFGAKTLIVVESGDAYFAGLPRMHSA